MKTTYVYWNLILIRYFNCLSNGSIWFWIIIGRFRITATRFRILAPFSVIGSQMICNSMNHLKTTIQIFSDFLQYFTAIGHITIL